jgi:hypothetical protein
MEEETPSSYSLLCSGCRTPCTGDDAHVVPGWNPRVGRVLTTYRCGNCWRDAIANTREAVTSGPAEVRNSFCEFLERQGYGKDAASIQAASPQQQEVWLLRVLDAVESGQIVFHP